jgi:arsenite/tail-anchored protein-transporting ATPase
MWAHLIAREKRTQIYTPWSVNDGSGASPVSSVSLMPVSDPIWSRELVLVTGKGGVGKTTLTAALGRLAQASGRRVLIAEVTPDLLTRSVLLSHFGHARPRTDEPFRIENNLFGVRIAPQSGHRLFLRQALKIRIVVDAAMRSAALTRFLMAAPTFPEIGVLFQIVHFLRQRRFDHIIIDLPATGHALALAALPRVVHRIVPTGLIGDAIKEGLDCLTSPERCCAIIPTLPESMPVTETSELITALADCDITVGGVILNKMPQSPMNKADRAKLAQWSAQNPNTPFLGARELVRLDRAYAARKMFYDILPSELAKFEIPETFAKNDRARISQLTPYLKTPVSNQAEPKELICEDPNPGVPGSAKSETTL